MWEVEVVLFWELGELVEGDVLEFCALVAVAVLGCVEIAELDAGARGEVPGHVAETSVGGGEPEYGGLTKKVVTQSKRYETAQ